MKIFGMKPKVVLAVVIISIMTFTLYKMANQGVQDTLASFGVGNFYVRGLVILGIGFAALFFIGKKGAIKDVLRL